MYSSLNMSYKVNFHHKFNPLHRPYEFLIEFSQHVIWTNSTNTSLLQFGKKSRSLGGRFGIIRKEGFSPPFFQWREIGNFLNYT